MGQMLCALKERVEFPYQNVVVVPCLDIMNCCAFAFILRQEIGLTSVRLLCGVVLLPILSSVFSGFSLSQNSLDFWVCGV